jgi:tetratricopeptide (TPR) repeat protein
MTPQAPEIFQRPLAEIQLGSVPPPRHSPEFEQAVIYHFAMHYAAKGWSTVVTVDDEFVRVVAVPEQGIEPKRYVLGLLGHGFLEDALPLLEALHGMVDDAEIAYNYGICLSELGRIQDSVAPLEKCIQLDPQYTNAFVGLGVAYTKLGRHEDAERVLRKAIALEPENAYAKRNLAGVLFYGGKAVEALPYFRQAVSLAPDQIETQMGLAQCLEQLGDEYRKEADKLYADITRRFPDHPLTETARQALTKIAHTVLHAAVDGNVRIDAVTYMQSALKKFSKMPKPQVGQITMEIAVLGRSGLSINDPDKRYALESLPGDFSGLQLLSMMHVGIRMFDPKVDTGSGLDREYDVAKGMRGKQ